MTGEDGAPLLGATVIAKGTSEGTTTDFDGEYRLNIVENVRELVFSYVGYKTEVVPIYASNINVKMEMDHASLEEVVVTAYSTTRRSDKNEDTALEYISEESENLTSNTYKLKEKHSIDGSGESIDLTIKELTIPTTYSYYTAPVINENVFLKADLKDWEQYDLLPGEAQVYFDGSYNGITYFDPDLTEEELTVSLGIDPQIRVERKEITDYADKSFFGGKRIIDKKYRLTLKNNRSNRVSVTLEDRIPISTNSEIDIDDEEFESAQINEDTQVLTWLIDLSAGESASREFSYEVRYPKDRTINLD